MSSYWLWLGVTLWHCYGKAKIPNAVGVAMWLHNKHPPKRLLGIGYWIPLQIPANQFGKSKDLSIPREYCLPTYHLRGSWLYKLLRCFLAWSEMEHINCLFHSVSCLVPGNWNITSKAGLKCYHGYAFYIMNTVNASTGFSSFQLPIGCSPQILPPLLPNESESSLWWTSVLT